MKAWGTHLLIFTPTIPFNFQQGVQSHITALLAIYKLYRPHLVSLVVPSTQRVYFRSMEKVWSAQVRLAEERISAAGRMEESIHERLHGTLTDSGPVCVYLIRVFL